MQQEILNRLKELGFKEYEAKAFTAMLKGIPMSASEIAKEANITRNAVYDVLKFFVQKGYCNEIETNTIQQYQIIDPEIIFGKLQKDYHEGYKKSVEKIQNTLENVIPLYKKGAAENTDVNIEVVRGFNKFRESKYVELIKKAEYEICGMYRFKGIITAELDNFARNFMKKGGVIRSIYQSTLDFKIADKKGKRDATTGDLVRICRLFEKSGENVRISESPIPNMTIIDGKTVFTHIGGKNIPRHAQADIVVHEKDHAVFMTELFEMYWSKSLTVAEFAEKENLKSLAI